MTAGFQPTGRLFIAAMLPPDILAALKAYARTIEPAFPGRYVMPENYHVTLAFLGDTPLSLAPDISRIIADTCGRFEHFETRTVGTGYFGKKQNAILWGALENAAVFEDLARVLRSGLKKAGFTFDPKPAAAHVTLARHVDLSGARTLPDVPKAEGTVDTVALFHSTRRNGVLTYIPLEGVLLA